MKPEYDLIAIGDIVTDNFIRLENPSAHLDIDKGEREICMRFADKIPYKEVHIIPAVGNSPNAAVAASRLGLKVALVTSIGSDHFGKECVRTLEKEGVSTEFVFTEDGMKTNYHYVLWYEDDRTILIKHEKFSHTLGNINTPKWVYLSSLGENTLPFHKVIENYLNKHKDINLAFQPGTYQIKSGMKLSGLYKRAKVVLCNKEESQRILKTEEGDIKKLLHKMRGLGSEIVVITDGIKGAYATTNGDMWCVPPYRDPKAPLERTGAGDAFSSTFISALSLGHDVKTAMEWAPVNSMSVVQHIGAREGLLTKKQIEAHLRKAPKNYKVKKL